MPIPKRRICNLYRFFSYLIHPFHLHPHLLIYIFEAYRWKYSKLFATLFAIGDFLNKCSKVEIGNLLAQAGPLSVQFSLNCLIDW